MENLSEKEFLIAFGKNLRKHRIVQGYTQAKLVNDIGAEISQISRIERGIINTSVANVNAKAIVLHIDIKEFLQTKWLISILKIKLLYIFT